MPILKDVDERAHEVYCAEMASGISILWPLSTVNDAQTLVDWLIKRPVWKRHSAVKKVVVSYAPHWDIDSSCGWTKEHLADMDLTLGSLCIGTVAHEASHLARRDRDNGHRYSFLRFQFALIKEISDVVAETILPRYARELYLRSVVTGREDWLRPFLTK